MVNILAFSDEELISKHYDDSYGLKFNVPSDVDLLINCGDLSPSYAEYIRFHFNPSNALMVHGNHDKNFLKKSSFGKYDSSPFGAFKILNADYLTLENMQGLIVAGFSGADNRGSWPFFFKEKHIKNFIKNLSKNFDSLDIMLSHHPPDIGRVIPSVSAYHTPSKVLGEVYDLFKPSIWFYGHVHGRYTSENLDFLIKDSQGNETYLINTTPYKFLEFDPESKKVNPSFDVEMRHIK